MDKEFGFSTNGEHLTSHGPGTTSFHETEPAHYNPSTRSTNDAGVRNRKENYALTLQKACGVALQRVKNNNVIANTDWAAPLEAAPSAISTMAILLKAADLEAAAGLEVDSEDGMADGNAVGHLQ